MISPMAAGGQAIGVIKAALAGALMSCLLAHPTIGVFTWMQYRKAAVKREIAKHILHGIGEADLVVLKFSRQET
jgi:hypothetical protein